jgi:ATP-dependent DNA helicase RecG
MDQSFFLKLLAKAENEIIEFKEAKNTYDFSKIGKYFSALSNEANLCGKDCAWLLFGVEDKHRKIVGTTYRLNRTDLDSLKKEIADKTTNRITFIEIFECRLVEGRILAFQIPAAPKNIPIAFEGHYYGREGEALSPLNLEELDRIRSQPVKWDWSAGILEEATLADLDTEAIVKARKEFKKRNPKSEMDIDTWNDAKFLDKAKLTIKGKMTRTALILLGKPESAHFIGSFVKIRWNLKSLDHQDRDYEIFDIPLILAVDKVYQKIRNLKYLFLHDGSLFPDEMLRYEPFSIRELINNAIAHQDYTEAARINVVEYEDDHLIVSNYGRFIPQSVENVVLQDTPEEFYRNPFLVEAMKNLDMIETQGGGIRKIFNFQTKRFFPIPDYDLSNGKVKVKITAKILDDTFARILSHTPQLSLEDILILDKVQKKRPISDDEFKYLKKLNFIEGRKPNIYLSFKVVAPTLNNEVKAQYINNKSFDDDYFKKIILEYLKKFKQASRKDFEDLLIPKLSASLTETQKKSKVGNLLSNLRAELKIVAADKKQWRLSEL